MIRKIFILFLLLLITSTVFAGGAAEEDAETLVVVREQGTNNLDIMGIGTNRPGYGLSWNVYDRLLTYGTKTLPDGQVMYDYKVLEPELAESWEVSPDGTYVDFFLKEAAFHDGTPVTAEDVKWSFDRAVSVGGFATFQMRAGSLESTDQFEVVNEKTFRIKLLREDKLTLPDIAVPIPAIYNSTVGKANATNDDPWALNYFKVNTAGSGAYMVEEFEPGVRVVLSRNDNWASGPLPYFKKVVLQIIPDASTRRALLEQGDADVSFDLPPKDFAELSKATRFKVAGVPIENFMWYVDMNVKVEPFDDVMVRKAIAAAIPYDKIFETVTFGRAAPLYGGSSKTAESIEWPQPYPNMYDLQKAKEYLAKSSVPEGFNAKLYYSLGTATWGEPSALLIQESLKDLGIDVTLEKVPSASWRAKMGEKQMPFLVNNFGGWLNYPDYFFFWNYHSQNGVFNTMNYGDPVMDKYIDAARFAESKAEYESNVKGFLTEAFDKVPRIPLFQSNLDVAMKPEIMGYQFWFHRQIDFRTMYRE